VIIIYIGAIKEETKKLRTLLKGKISSSALDYITVNVKM
jgi:hypothetical protein